MDVMGAVQIGNERLRVECRPAQGFVISAIRDLGTEAEAIWMRSIHEPAPCSRALVASGDASIETFLDCWPGGWFEMFPAVGYPRPGDATSLLHGELVRLPWTVTQHSGTAVTAEVRTLRAPFRVARRLAVEGAALWIDERVENVGAEPAPYLWGHHPCFARQTFAGGRIELDIAEAFIPAPAFEPGAALLRPAERFVWPIAPGREGPVDLAHVPAEPDGRVDHACLRPASGRLRVTAPSHGLALAVVFELAHFPYLLLWENFRARGGWPFWGDADTFALEWSSNPGRAVSDAVEAGAIRTLAPAGVLETEMRVAWEPLTAPADAPAASRARR
jgi:galactose mutarotase-like enzyme